jgi:hypothetical protein
VIHFDTVFGVLVRGGVEFIVIGGAAATIHGSARITRDVDIVYRRTAENLRRMVDALSPYSPYLRGAPAGLPFLWDESTLRRGLNFTLTTSIGDLDLLGEVTGGGNFEALLAHSSPVQAFGIECLCLNLDKLIQVKRAAGRPKDLEAIAELEALREERGEG